MQACPNNQSMPFREGYTAFTKSFFESVISLSEIFYDLEENTCDIDFDFSSMEAVEQIRLNEINFVKDQEEFRKGALLAEFNSLKIVIATYKPKSGKMVA